MSHSIRRPVAQYGLAAACVALAAGVTWALWESMYSSFVPLFVVAVALAAWFGGPRGVDRRGARGGGGRRIPHP